MKETFEDIFLHWVKTDVLSLDRMTAKTLQGPVLKSITSRIKNNIWGNGRKTNQGNKTN